MDTQLIEPAFRHARSLYNKTERHYHTWEHVLHCLWEFYHTSSSGHTATELAIIFHDVVYDPVATDNEEKSADIAKEFILKNFSFTPSLSQLWASNVYDLIMCTKTHTPIEGKLEQNSKEIIDIDLAILGQDSDEFDRYERGIREEYRVFPDDIYNKERAKILKSFLDKEFIYFADLFRAKYEDNARKNIATLIKKITPLS